LLRKAARDPPLAVTEVPISRMRGALSHQWGHASKGCFLPKEAAEAIFVLRSPLRRLALQIASECGRP
jgi:hypothetical protein